MSFTLSLLLLRQQDPAEVSEPYEDFIKEASKLWEEWTGTCKFFSPKN